VEDLGRRARDPGEAAAYRARAAQARPHADALTRMIDANRPIDLSAIVPAWPGNDPSPAGSGGPVGHGA
jgi:hypothetical protein